ncbi:glycosyltransferase family 25 protein [Arthrobacter sp. TMN-50]
MSDFESSASLINQFSPVSVKSAHANRSGFLAYVDQLILLEGTPSAIASLQRYVEDGLMPALAAFAIRNISRHTNDYSLGVELATALREAHPNDSYVANSLLENILATGQLTDFSKALRLIEANKSMTIKDEPAFRLAATAAIGGEWEACRTFLGRTTEGNPATTRRRDLLAARITSAEMFQPREPHVSTAIINLREDSRKYDLAIALYEKMGLSLDRVEATRGTDISKFVRSSVVSKSGQLLGPGAVGCALSHIAAWERIANSTEQHGLILEDDGLPYSWQNIDGIIQDAGTFDILYVNERMSSAARTEYERGVSLLWDTLQSRPEKMHGWGADGYIVSREAAQKLLEMISGDKIVGHIDGQIGSYGIDAASKAISRAQRVGLNCRKNMQPHKPLRIKCLRFPLVASYDFGYSSIVSSGGHQ